MKVMRGVNDMWTTSPELAKLLVNPDDGYILSAFSHKWADFKCRHCGNVFNAYVHNIKTYGFKCPYCSDGISYPEKFVSNLLSQLNVKFKRDTRLNWSKQKRYDFYIEEYAMIIETHGMQHYNSQSSFHVSNKRNEKENDNYKKELAMCNNIKYYIELDCRYSELKYIKKSIVNSLLSVLFDLSNINWDLIDKQCQKSKLTEVCDIFNSGTVLCKEIAQKVKIHESTVSEYLAKGREMGLIDLTIERPHKTIKKPIIYVETQKVYDSLSAVGELGYNKSQVSECCNGKGKTAGGYHWCYVEDYNPDTYISLILQKDVYPKKVLCVETGKVYNNLNDVKADGFNPSNVSMVCNGKRNKHHKCHFKFVA